MAEGAPKAEGSKRWPRGQRFSLTPEGQGARSALADAIASARSATGGRDAQEAVVTAWASRYGVQAGDGNCLDELVNGHRNVAELAEALLPCGLSRSDVQGAIDRLVTAGLVSAIPKVDPNAMPPAGPGPGPQFR